MPNISIIIPTLNEEMYVGAVLKALSEQTVQAKEIIIVDGGSSDATQKIVKRWKNVSLYISEKSPAYQRTLGGQKAKGQMLVFLDADVFPEKDFLEKIVSEYNKKPFAIACPYYIGTNRDIKIHNALSFVNVWEYLRTICIKIVYLFFDLLFFLFQNVIPSGAGSCIIVDKTVFTTENGFNTQFTYDDIEFIRRVAKKRTFRMLPLFLKVSDRRFRKYGVLRMSIQYIFLSLFFIFNRFEIANYIPYRFGAYGNKK